MASTLGDFTLSAVAAPDDFIVGYDEAALNGERRWTVSTIANAVSGIITPALVETPAFTGTFKNKIINGNFDIWQRGTSLASGQGERFLADRFSVQSVGSTYTTARQSFTLGQTEVPGEPTYFHRSAVSSVAGTTNYALMGHRIESVKSLAGKTATLSFYAKADVAKPMSVEFVQGFGTGGSPSSEVISIGVQKLNLTTSWQKFTVTVNIPSISGKTLGTNNNDCLVILFWFDAHSNFNSRTNSLGQQSGTFDIAQVQLEEGSVATPFEQRPIGTELALCQRYYEKNYNLNIPPATAMTGYNIHINGVPTVNTFNNFKYNFSVLFQTKKRTSPAVTLYATDSGIGGNFSLGTPGSRVNIGVTVGNSSETGFHTASVTNSLQSDAYVNFTADAEL